jgi:hypothetical protein
MREAEGRYVAGMAETALPLHTASYTEEVRGQYDGTLARLTSSSQQHTR